VTAPAIATEVPSVLEVAAGSVEKVTAVSVIEGAAVEAATEATAP
jgi:hypothetical protein